MANEFIHWLSWPLFKKKAQSPNLRGVIVKSDLNASNTFTASEIITSDVYTTSTTTTDIYKTSKVILDVL